MQEERLTGIIQDYVQAYNNFDVERMLQHVHGDIEYILIYNQEVSLSIKGIQNFRQYSEELRNTLSRREIIITNIDADGDKAEVMMQYSGVSKIDLPEIKAGQEFNSTVKANIVFRYGKILMLKKNFL